MAVSKDNQKKKIKISMKLRADHNTKKAQRRKEASEKAKVQDVTNCIKCFLQ